MAGNNLLLPPDNNNSNEIEQNENEGIVPINNNNIFNFNLNPQDLLIIPESPELDSQLSSSSSTSSDYDSKLSKESDEKISVKEKSKIEFSICKNINFSYETNYENMNKISDGNYSKDSNLRKCVKKLIDFYLKEKAKCKNKTKNETSDQKSEDSEKDIKSKNEKKENILNKNNINIKSNNKKEESDVWAFLNEEEEENDINFNLDDSKSKDKPSFLNEKNHSKYPKNTKTTKNINFDKFARKSVFKNIYSNICDEENNECMSPGNKNKISSKKGNIKDIYHRGSGINIHTKKIKKQKNENILPKDLNLKNNENESLDLSNNGSSNKDDSIIKNNHKKYQKQILNDDEIKNNSKLDDISMKNLKDT
jgi:hypothetical protein